MKNLLLLVACICLALAGTAQNDSLQYYLSQANAAKQQGQLSTAYLSYKQAVGFGEKNQAALHGMAATAKELNYTAIARETYKKILALKYNDTLAIRELVQLNFVTRQWPAAIEMAQRATALNQGSNNEWVIVKSYYEMGESGSVVAYLDKAWRKDSSQAELAFIGARSFVATDNYSKAVAWYEKALRLSPDNETWMYEAAMTYSAIPDETHAVLWFEKAVGKGYPRTPDLMVSMANSYMAIKSYDKCLALIYEVLPSKPQDTELYYMAGEANFRLGKFEEAINFWEKQLSIDKTQARALYMIGITFIRKGEAAKGEGLCDKAIGMDPSLARLKSQKSEMGL